MSSRVPNSASFTVCAQHMFVEWVSKCMNKCHLPMSEEEQSSKARRLTICREHWNPRFLIPGLLWTLLLHPTWWQQTFPISHQPASASLSGPAYLLQFIYFLPVLECSHFLMRILPAHLNSSCFHVQRNEKASMTLCCIALPTEGPGLSLGSVSASSASIPTFTRPVSSIPTLCSASHPITQHVLVLSQTRACTRGPLGWLAARVSPGQWRSPDLRHSMKTSPGPSDVQMGCIRDQGDKAQMGPRCGLLGGAPP